MAVRRVDWKNPQENILKVAGCGNWIKIEVIQDQRYLLPDNPETLIATEQLVKEGFVVLPYMSPDLGTARRLESVGAATVMPLGAPIGSNLLVACKPGNSTASKKMFVEQGLAAEKKIIGASGLAGWGDTDTIHTKHWSSGLSVVGDFCTAVSENRPPLSPRVGVAAAKQANLVLAWVLGEGSDLL